MFIKPKFSLVKPLGSLIVLLCCFISTGIPMMLGPLGALAQDSEVYRQEISESKDREEMQLVGVQESKIADYQDGKTLTDVHGNRVRLEQYILRPQPNQLEFVSYTSRDKSVDTLKGLFTVNKDLPADIRKVGELDPQKWGIGKPEYYVKDVELSAANDKSDSVKFISEGGNLYKTFSGNDSTAESDDKFNLMYNKSEVKINEIVKVRAERSGQDPLQNIEGKVIFSLPDTTGKLIKFDGGADWLTELDVFLKTKVEVTWDGDKFAQINWLDKNNIQNKKIDWTSKTTFADGTYLSQRQVWIKDTGEALKVGSLYDTLKGLTLDNWAAKLSELNHESIWTATEFSGRSIDVIWSPSIFIKAATAESANQPTN